MEEVKTEEGEIVTEDESEITETPQMIKIGEREYTVEELSEITKKAEGYEALLPDYTKKAQRLAELEKGQAVSNVDNRAPYEKEDWVPKDYKELAQAIKFAEERGMEKAVERLETKAKEQLKVQQEAKQELDNFVSSTKSKDKDFDDQDFFEYVTRHKFKVNDLSDLHAVYSSYSELSNSSKDMKEKGRMRVNTRPSSGDSKIDLSDIRSSRMSVADAAIEAFHRLKG